MKKIVGLVGFIAVALAMAIVFVPKFLDKGPTVSSEFMNDSDIIFPQLNVSYGEYKEVPASPYIIAQVTSDYMLSNDSAQDILLNFRTESARRGQKKLSSEFIVNNLNDRLESIAFPEPPQAIIGNVYYSHSTGVKPTYLRLDWLAPSGGVDDWKKIANDASLRAVTEGNVIQKNPRMGIEVCASTYRSEDGSMLMEITWSQQIVKEDLGDTVVKNKKQTTEKPKIINVIFAVNTEADMQVRAMYEQDMKIVSNDIERDGALNLLGFEFRKPITIPAFRKQNERNVMGMKFIPLTDRRIPKYENTPVLSTSLETWNDYIVTWKAAVLKSDWDKIAMQFAKEITGMTDVTAEKLRNGIQNSSGILLKAQETKDVGNAGERVVNISITDKKTDGIVTTALQKYNSVFVEGLRANMSDTIKTDAAKETPKAKPETQTPAAPQRITPPGAKTGGK